MIVAIITSNECEICLNIACHFIRATYLFVFGFTDQGHSTRVDFGVFLVMLALVWFVLCSLLIFFTIL